MLNGLVKRHGYSHEEHSGSLICQCQSDLQRKVCFSCSETLAIILDCIISCGLISYPLCSCAVGGRRDNPKAPEESPRCLQRRPSRGPRCGRSSPRNRGMAGSNGSECRRGGTGFKTDASLHSRLFRSALSRRALSPRGRLAAGPPCSRAAAQSGCCAAGLLHSRAAVQPCRRAAVQPCSRAAAAGLPRSRAAQPCRARPRWRSLIFRHFSRKYGTYRTNVLFYAFSAQEAPQAVKLCSLKWCDSYL